MTVTIQSEPDPRRPGRIAYRIHGPTKGTVQDEIDALMRPVDENGGFANFIGPLPVDGGYGAVGEVIVFDAEVRT